MTRRRRDAPEPVRVLVAHPSNELYGADRMLLRSAAALAEAGCEVTVALPGPGQLSDEMRHAGLRVIACPMPVLRKGALNPRGLLRLVATALLSLRQQVALVRRADVVYVNTVTVPTWLPVARLMRRRVVVHVREAEVDAPVLLRVVLLAPLLLAHLAICNSQATESFVRSWALGARTRTRVVHNGFSLPPAASQRPLARPPRLVVVGRLSPRKGQDVAVAALSILSGQGRECSLALAGDTFAGYEWFADELRAAAQRLAVEFLGFVADPGPVYESADVVLVPSRVEPFGNVAVEALAFARPVIASAVQGLVEIVERGGGVLVPAGDAVALAGAVSSLLSLSDERRHALGTAGRAQVVDRFSAERYAREVVAAVCGARVPPRSAVA